mmetsp:Transcript_15684/g.19904  ORF Transcript_15684/g.19904 Transcript_15684/m.19904 type:complete len:86 (+) Transcript_15684:62-319(+)
MARRQHLLIPTYLLLVIVSASISEVSSFTFGINSASRKRVDIMASTTTSSCSRRGSQLRMMEECPEIPTTAQIDPKYDTCIIALG